MLKLEISRVTCPTNYELFYYIDPNKIIKTTNSSFSYSNLDELIFESVNDSLHNDLVSLSLSFPNEVFIATNYDVENDEAQYAESHQYISGEHELICFVPFYHYTISGKLKVQMGIEIYNKLWKRVKRYLMRLDQTRKNFLSNEPEIDILEHHYDDCVSSNITINAELDNFKLAVHKLPNSELIVTGYMRNSIDDEWIEIR